VKKSSKKSKKETAEKADEGEKVSKKAKKKASTESDDAEKTAKKASKKSKKSVADEAEDTEKAVKKSSKKAKKSAASKADEAEYETEETAPAPKTRKTNLDNADIRDSSMHRGKVNLNVASTKELLAAGFTSEQAVKIMAGRPWQRKDSLRAKGILTDAEYKRVQANIIAHQD
jgi:hypothetical protein